MTNENTDDGFFDVDNTLVVPTGTVVEDDQPGDAGSTKPPEDGQPPEGDDASKGGGQDQAPKDDQSKPPEWTGSLSADEKKQILEGWLTELPYEERVKLAPVAEVENRTRQSQTARVANELETAQERQARLTEKATRFDSLATRLKSGQVPQDIEKELDDYAEVASTIATESIRQEMWNQLTARMAAMGVDSIPKEIFEKGSSQKTMAEGLGVYIDWMLAIGDTQASARTVTDKEAALKANYTVDVARIKADHLAELREQGLLKDSSPPVISGRTAGGEAPSLTEEKLADIDNWTDEEHELFKPQLQQLAKELLVRR